MLILFNIIASVMPHVFRNRENLARAAAPSDRELRVGHAPTGEPFREPQREQRRARHGDGESRSRRGRSQEVQERQSGPRWPDQGSPRRERCPKEECAGELEAAENTANMNDKVRATALIDELVNRHYDHPSRIAATQLINANAKIIELKVFLKKPYKRYSQIACLQILQHGEHERQGACDSVDRRAR
ncbi:hypothetical protein BDR22DRAFT_384991 [Usnea florida]